MKKIIISLMLALLILPTAGLARDLSADLRGRILLQVENNGEAWYVHPDTLIRHYMGRPADAFALMRNFGLGIKHAELAAYLADGGFPARLAGRIVLDVEKNGEAYYIYPLDLNGYYLGRPDHAFAIMRKLGLGIRNSDLGAITAAETQPPEESRPPEEIYTDALKPIVKMTYIGDNFTASFNSDWQIEEDINQELNEMLDDMITAYNEVPDQGIQELADAYGIDVQLIENFFTDIDQLNFIETIGFMHETGYDGVMLISKSSISLIELSTAYMDLMASSPLLFEMSDLANTTIVSEKDSIQIDGCSADQITITNLDEELFIIITEFQDADGNHYLIAAASPPEAQDQNLEAYEKLLASFQVLP